MSLILDALRKLERDKQARDPAVVVVGHIPWGGRDVSRRTRIAVLAAMGTLLVATAGALVWLARPDTRPGPPSAPASRDEDRPAEAAPQPRAPGSEASPPPPAASAPAMATAPEAISAKAPPPREMPVPDVDKEPSVADPGAAPGGAPPPAETVSSPPASTPRPRLLLTAISERDGAPVAVLNDRLVHEGDSVDGARVLRIGATEVEVEIDGKREVIGF